MVEKKHDDENIVLKTQRLMKKLHELDPGNELLGYNISRNNIPRKFAERFKGKKEPENALESFEAVFGNYNAALEEAIAKLS